MLLMAEVMQGFNHLGSLIDAIAENDDQPAMLQTLGHLMQDRRERRFLLRLRLIYRPDEAQQMRRRGARGKHLPYLIVESHQSCRILLTQNQIAQTSPDKLRVAKFAHRIALPAIRHRTAGIQHDMGLKRGRDLILLDVKPIGLGENAPVQPFDVIAGCVLAVLCEIQRKAQMRRAMQTLHIPIHELFGDQFQPADFRQRGGVEQRSWHVTRWRHPLIPICVPFRA